jgi:hypothetical protein
MPEHGNETAPHACCRPSSPSYKGPNAKPAPSRPLAFWRDRSVWKVAARNTLNCLVGCSIGDLAVIIYMQAVHPHVSMWLTMGLAMAAGLVTSILFESTMLRFREDFAWKQAVVTAFSMSFLSMLGMELAANLTDYLLTGGKVAMHHPFYWTALGISLIAGFLAPLPFNYWQFKKHGKACH